MQSLCAMHLRTRGGMPKLRGLAGFFAGRVCQGGAGELPTRRLAQPPARSTGRQLVRRQEATRRRDRRGSTTTTQTNPTLLSDLPARTSYLSTTGAGAGNVLPDEAAALWSASTRSREKAASSRATAVSRDQTAKHSKKATAWSKTASGSWTNKTKDLEKQPRINVALFQGTRKQGPAPAQEIGQVQGGVGQEACEHGQDPLARTRCDSEDPLGWTMNLILDSSGERDKAAKAAAEPRELILAVIQLLPYSAEAQGKRRPANPKQHLAPQPTLNQNNAKPTTQIPLMPSAPVSPGARAELPEGDEPSKDAEAEPSQSDVNLTLRGHTEGLCDQFDS
eukprot:209593-Rhodomonas_salina.2